MVKKARKNEREWMKIVAKTASHEPQFKFTTQSSTQNGFTTQSYMSIMSVDQVMCLLPHNAKGEILIGDL